MRAIPAIAIVVGGWGAAACGGSGYGGGMDCEELVVQDTIQAFDSGGQLMVMAKRDTQPKPYSMCVTLKAARDTQPRP